MILIIDNGSQYTHLIKRNCMEFGYVAEMLYNKVDYEKVEDLMKSGIDKIILSGGPSSVYEDPPNLSSLIATKAHEGEITLPILGICYGQQMIAHIWGAKVGKGTAAGYGAGEIEIDEPDELFSGVPQKLRVWVSHFDEVKELPEGFARLAHSKVCNIEAIKHKERSIFGVQFHPEVWHTENGEDILRNFLEIPGQK
jgi:GMP synthase (glutamine-hydrolysing)